jgi:hypothetical protein
MPRTTLVRVYDAVKDAASRWQSVQVILRARNAIAVTSPPATINRVMTSPRRNTSRAPMEEDAARRLDVLGRAPELVGVDPWFNTPDGEHLRVRELPAHPPIPASNAR